MPTTYDAALTVGSIERTEPSFARRLFDRYVEARQKEANRRIVTYLQSLDSSTLRGLGYTNAQIEQLHGGSRGL